MEALYWATSCQKTWWRRLDNLRHDVLISCALKVLSRIISDVTCGRHYWKVVALGMKSSNRLRMIKSKPPVSAEP